MTTRAPGRSDLPEAVTSPVRVVTGLVMGLDPGLSVDAITGIVTGVAAGRAKRRRLAGALTQQPGLLQQGRSPAPKVVGELLIALVKAGALNVSPPRCATCSKELRTLARRGQDWYCSRCGTQPEPCTRCGKTRAVSFRDQDKRPRCWACPPDEGLDPLEVITAVVQGIDPEISPDTVHAAVRTVAATGTAQRHLAWALQDRGDLLTGNGAQASSTVLALIDLLAPAGAGAITRPPCPGCGRMIALVTSRAGIRMCNNCASRSRAQTCTEICARCGRTRAAPAREPDERAVCAKCISRDVANQEICIRCHRMRPVCVRSPGGPICESCRPWPILTCSICARTQPCQISAATGQPRCHTCKHRWARCCGCGQVQRLRSGTLARPLCTTCTTPGAGTWPPCPTCGDTNQIRGKPCIRCVLKTRLQKLLSPSTGSSTGTGTGTGLVRPQLQALADSLAAHEHPVTVMTWLRKAAARNILADLAGGRIALTHQGLDELPDTKWLRHLRAMLVTTGALPVRDENLARLQQWMSATIGARPDPGEQHLLHQYGDWHLVRRLRGRSTNGETTYHQVVGVRQRITAAIGLFQALNTQGLTLATITQPQLDAWLTSKDTTHAYEAGQFIRWAATNKLTTVHAGSSNWAGPAAAIDDQTRWSQARRLLHEASLKPEDRVAGLLLLLYAQRAATISRLQLHHVQADDSGVRLRMGPEPVLLPEPLAGLVRDLLATRHGKATLADQGTSTWLFPGGHPGRPISAYQLGKRLARLGIRPSRDRSAALFQLSTELPAALLARMLGIHISAAVTWQRASAGDWTTYAADVASRSQPTPPPEPRSQPTI